MESRHPLRPCFVLVFDEYKNDSVNCDSRNCVFDALFSTNCLWRIVFDEFSADRAVHLFADLNFIIIKRDGLSLDYSPIWRKWPMPSSGINNTMSRAGCLKEAWINHKRVDFVNAARSVRTRAGCGGDEPAPPVRPHALQEDGAHEPVSCRCENCCKTNSTSLLLQFVVALLLSIFMYLFEMRFLPPLKKVSKKDKSFFPTTPNIIFATFD